MKISIQGERGSFSEEAALGLAPRARIVPCATFADVFAALLKGKVDRALVPIENTLAGSVAENYDLLRDSAVSITHETQLRIRHNLIVAPGTTLGQIRRVISHPVALQQCRIFLARHAKWRSEPFYDTAGSVKYIMETGSRDTAAIAGSRAASLYAARIVKNDIEDNKKNFTRFFLLSRRTRRVPGANKVSVVFATRNVSGALFKCLSVFALRDISLTRIESRPVPGQPWEYSFYVDFMGNIGESNTQNALRHLGEITDFLKVLGAYRAAERDPQWRSTRR
jgi:prephenate dehydratase